MTKEEKQHLMECVFLKSAQDQIQKAKKKELEQSESEPNSEESKV